MSFESAIRRVPVPFDPDAGRAVVSALGLSGPLGDLIAGAAGCSPYLRDCLASEGGWLTTALDAPETALTALGAEADHLRRDKRRMALLVALADLGGVWDLDRVTRAITDFADRAVATALDAA
ncbi:MAG: glutamine-synthetase adenylyltransferase, partial [Pseudomonadota bacterium]